MPFPDLTEAEVAAALPQFTDIRYIAKGGQKCVFGCLLNGARYALKFLRPNPILIVPPSAAASMPDPISVDNVTARAQREVETMKECACDSLVRIGPAEITPVTIGGDNLIYFTEEFIEGQDLRSYQRQHGPLPIAELKRLGLQMIAAIERLWQRQKIHLSQHDRNVPILATIEMSPFVRPALAPDSKRRRRGSLGGERPPAPPEVSLPPGRRW